MVRSYWAARLQRLAGRFVGHFPLGQPAEFVLHQRQQLAGSVWIALFNLRKNPRHVCHAPQDIVRWEFHQTHHGSFRRMIRQAFDEETNLTLRASGLSLSLAILMAWRAVLLTRFNAS